MKKLIILFIAVMAFTACNDEADSPIVASIIIQNDRLTFFGGFTVSTDYEVVGTSADGEFFSVSGSVSSGGQQSVFLDDEELKKGSTLTIYANSEEIHSRTVDGSFNIIYHDEPSPTEDWIAEF